MCGIAGGYFSESAVAPDRAERAVAAMVAALAHRGPDGQGVCSSAAMRAAGHDDGFVVLGHTRLAIIDPTAEGAQPMGLGDASRLQGRLWNVSTRPHASGPADAVSMLTYNGETYNFVELKRELEHAGARFATRSDTEVVLRGYDAWGIDLLPRLRGMFAFALWDQSRHCLLLARDRLGIKPLYYYCGDGFLLFASEVRALVGTGLVPRRIDAIALWHYLGYQSVPAPRTLVEGVRVLEPAHWMRIDRGGVRHDGQYWNMLDAADSTGETSPDVGRRRTGELLREAVAGHLVSDVPVGAFLSGGIDSSAVVALMREAGHRPRTFSVGFAERAFDESAHAELVARRAGADHTHIQLHEPDLLDRLPAALQAMDQPTGDGINTYIISGAVRAQGMKVALSGLGGDELFGGYPSFSRLQRAADIARLWSRWPASVRSAAAAAVRTIGQSSVRASKAAAVMESDGSLAAMFPLTRRVLSNEQRAALISPNVLEQIGDPNDPYDALLADAYERAPDAGFLARVSFAEARTYMHDVLLRDTDQMSLAHGLEVRVPLLDHPLVDWVTALPDRCKQSNGTPKRLLVEALGPLLPEEIVHRPKQGFTLPFEPWMRGAMRPFCERHLDAAGPLHAVLRVDQVERLWRSFLSGGSDVSWSRLWILVVLDAWLTEHPLEAA